jgi:hypothetical protein
MKNKEAIEAYKHRLKNEVDISEKELIDELQTSSNNLEKIIDKVVMGGVAISGIYYYNKKGYKKQFIKKI